MPNNTAKTPKGAVLPTTLYPAPVVVGEEPAPELVPEWPWSVAVEAVAAGSVALLIEVVATTLTVGVPFSTVK